MLVLVLVISLFSSVFAYDSCPSRRWSRCSLVHDTSSIPCSDYYEFMWNTTTGEITTPPRRCAGWNGCIRGDPCQPPCSGDPIFPGEVAKVGGPEDIICAFLTQPQCLKYYAYRDGGDRWCYKKDGSCTEYSSTCHD